MIKPTLTKTFVLDIGRKCQINCRFCYHHHLGDLRKQGWRETSGLKNDIHAGKSRGNNYCDVTGGSPDIHPDMPDLVRFAKDNDIRMCIISNALTGENRTQELIDAGVDEFLVSVHGMPEVHDKITQLEGSRLKQVRFLKQITEAGIKLRFNFVITQWNQFEIYEVTKFMEHWRPHIINFINFNPHIKWKTDPFSQEIVADLRTVEKELNKSIEFLENNGIGVNVRYYPMCRIAERYRRCICNQIHVMFDPREWDYCLPRNFNTVRQHWINESRNVEEKGEPCNRCDLQWICGGANKHWHAASKEVHGELLIPQSNTGINGDDFYHYRKMNVRTLGER